MIPSIPSSLKELRVLLKAGEGSSLKFKRSTGELKEGLQTACAFLNGDGGMVIFGVRPDQRVLKLESQPEIRPESVHLGTKRLKGSQKSSQKSSQKILEQIIRQPEVTIDELAAHIGISARAIKKHLRNLKENAKLKRIGPDRGGRREVIS